MKHLDLFSGIGGFAMAAQWAGMKTIGFCEIDPFCRKVLDKHWPDVVKYKDIRDLINPEHADILTAGFPCQPFSVAGKRKGKEDDRYLWPELMRIIRQSKPNWFIGENVPGIIPVLDPILEDLENEGYSWRSFLISASSIGAPHKRERLWIIANLDGKRCDSGIDNREERQIQDNGQRYTEKIQSDWPQFIPKSWQTFNAQEWLGFTPDSEGKQCNERTKNNETITKRSKWSKSSSKNRHVSNANGFASIEENSRTVTKSQEWNSWGGHTRQYRENYPKFNWEENEPPIPGVDDGLPYGVDRNKALGNAIVPQIPFVFMSLIKLLESQNYDDSIKSDNRTEYTERGGDCTFRD